MEYEHTQKAPLVWIVLGADVLVLAGVCVLFVLSNKTEVLFVPVPVIVLTGVVAFCFGSLTVRDEGEYLRVRFGPLRVFGTKIAYTQIAHVEPARSNALDGWGIHGFPGRGVIYNLWGFDCVRIGLGNKTVRIGTDDVEGLLAFLNTKVGGSAGDADG